MLGGEGVALVPGQVQHLRAGFFMDPDEQHGSGVSFFLGQRKTSDEPRRVGENAEHSI